MLADAIFEKVSGRPLLAFLQEKIFDPLGMTSAGGLPAGATQPTPSLTPASPSVRRDRSGAKPTGWYFAAGELVHDAFRPRPLGHRVPREEILSAKSYDEFTREMKLKNGDSTHYALGLSLVDLSGIPTFPHGGEVSGFISSNMVFARAQRCRHGALQ